MWLKCLQVGFTLQQTSEWPKVCWCSYTKGGRLVTVCRGLSPADSPRTGQNAETRSNGAALGRAMMLFLSPLLNTAGAAGFSAQGSLLLYEKKNINTGQLPGDKTGWIWFPQNKKKRIIVTNNSLQITRCFSLYQCMSLRMSRCLIH